MSFSTTNTCIIEQPKLLKKINEKFETCFFLPESSNRLGEGGLRTKGKFKSNHINKPLVTVITIVYNDYLHIEKTILSVLNQTYTNVEYIIVDGGSSDGTLDIIRKYEQAIDYWTSERDAGIYDAMNKGIILAAGTWINFMNSGDLFYENKTISAIIKNSMLDLDLALIYGNTNRVSDNTLYLANIKKAPSDFTLDDLLMKMPICHQSIFFSLWSFKHLGLYDTSYKICADHDWLIKARLNNCKSKYLSFCISSYNMDGISSSSIFNRERERLKIALVHFDKKFKPKLYIRVLISVIKLPIKFSLSKLNLLSLHLRIKI